jgi:hypothetical protein
MGLLRILLRNTPREPCAPARTNCDTRGCKPYQEPVRFGDAGSGFRQPDVMEELDPWPTARLDSIYMTERPLRADCVEKLGIEADGDR